MWLLLDSLHHSRGKNKRDRTDPWKFSDFQNNFLRNKHVDVHCMLWKQRKHASVPHDLYEFLLLMDEIKFRQRVVVDLQSAACVPDISPNEFEISNCRTGSV